MNFALERYKEQIIVNEAFRDSLQKELESNHISEGTILLAANEILFDPGFGFTYGSNGNSFPGRIDMIIVADRFDSMGRMIDISWPHGRSNAVGVPPKAGKGDPASKNGNRLEDIKRAGRGNTGRTGNPGGLGGNGMNIKVFCDHLVSIQITSNGGSGGRGGQGGQGGDGGDGGIFSVLKENPPPKFTNASVPGGQAGKGGPGGPGGPGGNGGKIELLYCNPAILPTIHLVSNGGRGGEPGPPGPAGGGHQPLEVGDPGATGAVGFPSIPDVKKVGSTELWERVSMELGLSS